ncbi:peptidoglycan-binding protein [Arvimicrobium flavum]|uniref:peptidoglycan-binding domain-containing protein n=1 Tax=Arvimicrobium flavum TaxID=3393320 RepID=UPI00237A771C|nr:peptidoglycan-binding protein [Mesorhizobium shangrilense]
MARSSKRPDPSRERTRPAVAAASAVGGMIARNPALVGGSTAFLVALSFVSANALWYQPFAHPGAFFTTRTIERGDEGPAPTETTIKIERPEEAHRQIVGDPITKAVQTVLKDLNLYDGAVDGLSGPNTRRAVEAYQKTVGLPVTGLINEQLLEQLDTSPTAAIPPQPRPRPQSVEAIINEPSPARFDGEDNSAAGRVRKIQAGLREFGNKNIDIDGVLGGRTRAAIKEFQALFGLPQTGEADEVVFAKMRKEGLIN